MHRTGVELVELEDLENAHGCIFSAPHARRLSMRRTFAVSVLSLLMAVACAAQTVTFQTEPPGGGGFLAAPTTAGKHPALVVIQEWWGVDPWIRQQTERF